MGIEPFNDIRRDAVEVLRSLLVKSEDNDCGYELDFNKIIPMPEELNIESGSVTRDCAKLYVNAMLEGCDAYKKYAALYVQAFGKDVAMSEDEQIKTMQYALLHKDFNTRKVMFKTKSRRLCVRKKGFGQLRKVRCERLVRLAQRTLGNEMECLSNSNQ